MSTTSSLPELQEVFGPPADRLAGITAHDTTDEIAAILNLPDGWTDPEPISDALPEVAQFDLELMPKSLRPLVEDVADRMQVPLDFPAVTAVATLAGVTNRRALLQPKRNDTSWVVVPNLWGGIVASPGMLKSPVIASITKPAREIENTWREAFAAEAVAYRDAQELHEEDIKAWRMQYQVARKKNHALPVKPGASVVAPTLRRLTTSDGTFESLHQILSEIPVGFLYFGMSCPAGWRGWNGKDENRSVLSTSSAGTGMRPSPSTASGAEAFMCQTPVFLCLAASSRDRCGAIWLVLCGTDRRTMA